MTVRLIERFSESLPDWFVNAIKNTNSKIPANNRVNPFRADYYYGWNDMPTNGVFGTRHLNYPLDSIQFEERPIPKNMATIRRDFEAGDDPVLLVRPSSWVNDSESMVCIIHHTADRNHSDNTQFKNSWEDALRPIGWNCKWGDVKDRILKYGVILNGDQEVIDKNQKIIDRKANRKYWVVPNPDEIQRNARSRKRRMALGAYGIKMFKELDALYDDITETFDKALEKIDEVNDEKANDIFTGMKIVKTKYERAIEQIETIMNNAEKYSDRDLYNDDPSMYGFARYTKDSINSIKDWLDELKKKIS